MEHSHLHRTHLSNAVYFVTTNVEHRKRHFTDLQIASLLKNNIELTKALLDCIVFAYVIMPDHLHIQLQVKEKTVSEVIHSIKRNSSRDINRLLKNLYGGETSYMAEVWEPPPCIVKESSNGKKSFKDRVITDEHDFIKHIEYIKANSVKAGLVEKPEDYSLLFVDEEAIAKFFRY